jgi:zinc D-Ala-D-Ala carboxypeptidase
MDNISAHISYKEAVYSETAKRAGIDNIPSDDQLSRMRQLADKIFEPLRAYFGNRPIFIGSFFRSLALNTLIGGAKDSQHMANNGSAMDIDNEHDVVTNKMIFDYIKASLPFDQLIWEFGTTVEPDWVHVSYNEGNNRGQVLVAKRNNLGVTYYENYK